ncbi:MAG: adenosylcobinamide-phosphate synthase CbiB [Salinivirgaceae bacterium]|jgi:adenosylcobinamide-phosphate synthase|nr:adenosylcobinamide-phosphate synthase CbiB [Salinivirgaceae bacterium]
MNEFYKIAIPLIVGFLLDSFIGDPYKLPHPIRWFGFAISFFDEKLNTNKNRKFKGLFTVVILVAVVYLLFWIIIKQSNANIWMYYILVSVFVFYALANKSLIVEALKVESQLEKCGIEAGRKQLSFIVGRDTSKLNKNQIRTAVLETLSENLSDGVIAPMFYYAIGGVPLMFAYKMINTLDSMVGYKSERYKRFGYFAAKLDDFANFIPARITAFLMALVGFKFRAFQYIFKYGNRHASPNAGYPESALAGILNCRFGGSNIYHGKLLEKPFIGENNREILTGDIKKACTINWLTSVLFLMFVLFTFLWLC